MNQGLCLAFVALMLSCVAWVDADKFATSTLMSDIAKLSSIHHMFHHGTKSDLSLAKLGDLSIIPSIDKLVAGNQSRQELPVRGTPLVAKTLPTFHIDFDMQQKFPQTRVSRQSVALKPAVTILSGSSRERPWTWNVTDNHERFARSQGYSYKYVNMSEWTTVSRGKEPQWLKVRALLDTLRNTDSEHVLWVDDDVVFTSKKKFVEQMIRDLGEKSLLIARDIRLDQVNTGMMLFRRGHESAKILQQIWRKSKSPLGYCKEQSCFHEQEALNNLIDRGEICAQVVNPVNDAYNMNTMWRRSHYDEKRKGHRGGNMYLDYDENDPPGQRWRWGMNTAHVSGMTPSCRGPMLKWIAEYSRKFVFGSEHGRDLFQESNPYPFECRQHLRRKRAKQTITARPEMSFANSSFSRQRCMQVQGSHANTQTNVRSTLPVVGTLIEIVGSVLPDLFDHGPLSAQVELEVNYSQSATSDITNRANRGSAMNFTGQLIISADGEYDFFTELSNLTQVTHNVMGSTDIDATHSARVQSGKATLSVGRRNLSFEFFRRHRGAGVVFNYSWQPVL